MEKSISSPSAGRQHRHGGAFGDDDLARHFDGVNARVLPLDARVEDTAHEGRGGAVEDRNLGAVDLDHGVVDAAARQRGHDMFDGGDGRAAIAVQLRAQAALARRGRSAPQ
jgi:hypothetical protein